MVVGWKGRGGQFRASGRGESPTKIWFAGTVVRDALARTFARPESSPRARSVSYSPPLPSSLGPGPVSGAGSSPSSCPTSGPPSPMRFGKTPSEGTNAPSRDRSAVRFGRRTSSLRERAREERLLTAIRHGRAMRLAGVRVTARAFVCRARRRGNNRKRKARAEAFRFFVSSRTKKEGAPRADDASMPRRDWSTPACVATFG